MSPTEKQEFEKVLADILEKSPEELLEMIEKSGGSFYANSDAADLIILDDKLNKK